jgi:hypothetical protein
MDKNKSCIYCGKKVKARGFCNACSTQLYRKKVDMNNIDECIAILKERDNKKKNKDKNCIHCKKPVHIKMFCKRDYKYLKEMDCYKKNDIKECLRLLEKRDKNKNRRCLFCGEKHLAKGFCKKHYQYLYRRNYDLNDTKKCLEILRDHYTNKNK